MYPAAALWKFTDELVESDVASGAGGFDGLADSQGVAKPGRDKVAGQAVAVGAGGRAADGFVDLFATVAGQYGDGDVAQQAADLFHALGSVADVFDVRRGRQVGKPLSGGGGAIGELAQGEVWGELHNGLQT